MWKRISIVAALIAAGIVTFFFVGEVTETDIIAANKYTLPVQTEPLRAGHLVTLSEGGNVAFLCDSQVGDEFVQDDMLSEVYYNRMQNAGVWLVGFARDVGVLGDEKAANLLKQSQVPFLGEKSSFKGDLFSYDDPSVCHCKIARSIYLGERVCTVSSSLIRTHEAWVGSEGEMKLRPVQESLAVSLRRHVTRIPEEVFAACGFDYNDLARVTEQRLCADENSEPYDVLPRDVRLRRDWNLIASKPAEWAARETDG